MCTAHYIEALEHSAHLDSFAIHPELQKHANKGKTDVQADKGAARVQAAA